MAERKITGAVNKTGEPGVFTEGDEEELNGLLTASEIRRLKEAGEIEGDWDAAPEDDTAEEATSAESGDEMVPASDLEAARQRVAELENELAEVRAAAEQQLEEREAQISELKAALEAQEENEATDEEADTEEGETGEDPTSGGDEEPDTGPDAEATDEDTEDAETTARERWEERYQVSPENYLDRYGEDAEGAELARQVLAQEEDEE